MRYETHREEQDKVWAAEIAFARTANMKARHRRAGDRCLSLLGSEASGFQFECGPSSSCGRLRSSRSLSR